MRRKLVALASLVLVPLAVYACANDDDSPPGPKSVMPPSEAGAVDTSTPDTSAADAGDTGGGKVVAMCTQADFDAPASAKGGDYTGQPGVTITFPTGSAPAQYTNRCAKVKVGATVTFTGSFADHPLEPNGGDTPTPIPMLQNTAPDGGVLSLKPAAKGTFGYECNFHPSLMFGAIQVVP